MDRISQLPDFIIHHILSFLNKKWHDPPTDLVRMSVLSKTWFDLTASYPFLDFYIYEFTSPESFFKYVEYTTSRFCHQDVTAHRLKLNTTIEEPAELDIVNRCLELLFKKGVKVLDIDSSRSPSKYRLPNTLLSVSVLESLTVSGCELPSSLMLDAVKFKSLIRLELHDVHIDDEIIKYLASSCPLLQVFQIIFCRGFKRFCVFGHLNLRKVSIHYDTPVERIDIEAPNLQDVSIVYLFGRETPQMNFASCKKLTTVYYIGRPFPNSTGFLSNFPFVEDLVLTTNYKGNNLKFSSDSLRTFGLQFPNYDLADIELCTPNLGLFIYSSNDSLHSPLPKLAKRWSSVRDSSHLKPCMQCYPDGSIDALWFQKLRLFLDKNKGFKVFNLYIHPIYTQKFTKLEKLKAVELPPYELEHVELHLESHVESSAHIDFVKAVLWCCRPRSLTLRSSSPDFEQQSHLFRFTYGKLLQQEDQGCIQIVWPSTSGAQKHLMDLKSLSMGLSRAGKAISIIKEEVVKEEAGYWNSQRYADMETF